MRTKVSIVLVVIVIGTVVLGIFDSDGSYASFIPIAELAEYYGGACDLDCIVQTSGCPEQSQDCPFPTIPCGICIDQTKRELCLQTPSGWLPCNYDYPAHTCSTDATPGTCHYGGVCYEDETSPGEDCPSGKWVHTCHNY